MFSYTGQSLVSHLNLAKQSKPGCYSAQAYWPRIFDWIFKLCQSEELLSNGDSLSSLYKTFQTSSCPHLKAFAQWPPMLVSAEPAKCSAYIKTAWRNCHLHCVESIRNLKTWKLFQDQLPVWTNENEGAHIGSIWYLYFSIRTPHCDFSERWSLSLTSVFQCIPCSTLVFPVHDSKGRFVGFVDLSQVINCQIRIQA